MTLLEQLGAEITSAMRARDTDRLGPLRLLKSAIGYVQIERKTENLSDADVQAVIRKEIKKRQDAAGLFDQGGRPELAARERAEIAVLEAFLPQALSADELDAIVRAAIAETGATSKKQMGAVMKTAQAAAAGRADGRALSARVSALLP